MFHVFSTQQKVSEALALRVAVLDFGEVKTDLLHTVGIRCIQPPDVFPLTSMVNKSRNIECCVNNMLQIIQNMMVSQG